MGSSVPSSEVGVCEQHGELPPSVETTRTVNASTSKHINWTERSEAVMSVSLFRYEPWKCDGEFCIGDCDLCYKAEWTKADVGKEDEEEEDD